MFDGASVILFKLTFSKSVNFFFSVDIKFIRFLVCVSNVFEKRSIVYVGFQKSAKSKSERNS